MTLFWSEPDGHARLSREFILAVKVAFRGPHAAYRELVPMHEGQRLIPYSTWRSAFRYGVLASAVVEQIVALAVAHPTWRKEFSPPPP